MTMSLGAHLTQVDLLWIEKRIERWIRFGRVAEDRIVDRRRRIVGFTPGSIFAFVRWASNDHGTIVSRLDVVRAAAAGAPCSTIPGITPGGDMLLRAFGWPKVEQALRAIDAVEALGLDPADIAPDHWRHVHNRLSVGQAWRAYSHAPHKAWRLRLELH
jgi:hypothetical protein